MAKCWKEGVFKNIVMKVMVMEARWGAGVCVGVGAHDRTFHPTTMPGVFSMPTAATMLLLFCFLIFMSFFEPK